MPTLLLAVLFAIGVLVEPAPPTFSPEPLTNPPPATALQILNALYDGTNAEGWESVMTIEVPPLVYAQESNPPRGMGNDVEQWRPLVAGHFSDLGQDAVDMAMRIMACESGGNPSARNPRSTATGLMQIMASVWGPEFGFSRGDLEIPELNLWAAREVYDRQGWNAWTCWRR